MFYVTSLDGSQVEPLINIGNDFSMNQSVDGTFTVSFSVFPSVKNPGYDLLNNESVITVEGNDFKVKNIDNTANSKKIVAVNIFFENSKKRVKGIFSGSHTLNNHLQFALGSTGWEYTIEESIANQVNYIGEFGNDNIISLVDKIKKFHNCEYVILPEKKIHFAREIGRDNDYQYRYKHNISDVVLVEDTSNLFTFITGYGAEGLEVSYTSPNASIFGILESEPITDERFTDANSLGEYLKKSLNDNPELAIQSQIPELTEREIGERVWLIYEPLNIELQTRILQQTKVFRNGKIVTSSVVFGNAQIKSSTDLFIEQRREIKDTNKTLVEAKNEYRSSFEQTDNRITFEVEQLDASIAAVDVKADNINISVNNRITEEVAAINVRSDEIELSVVNTRDELNSTITQTASSIRSEVNDVKNGLESSIEQTATSIRSEVTNAVDGLESSIEQTASSIRSELTNTTQNLSSSIQQTASSLRTEFNETISEVNGDINGVRNNVSSLQQTASSLQSTVTSQATSINNLNMAIASDRTRITNAESRITQQANEISSKVSQTDYNGNRIASLINQTATTISINASKINLVGAVTVLSDITGDLGNITAGNINVGTAVTIGTTLQIGQNYQNNLPKAIRFAGSSGSAGISYDRGSMTISAVDRITLDADYIRLRGTVEGLTAVFG